MTFSRLILCAALAGTCLSTPAIAQTSQIDQMVRPAHAEQARIQIALLLDTSNSMDGLIAQAKSQLWMLVNELAEGEKYGKAPEIELALYEYGNSNISVAKGYVRQVLPLTTDLDAVSEKLFSLKTNGGQEYAGQVIDTALSELEWSGASDDMKLVIIAGNEPFTQGPVNFETACARAKRSGIIIDTIHCGSEEDGISGKWKAGAECAGGLFMTINQDEQYVHIPSPYDSTLLELNEQLNQTYFGYGVQGAEMKQRQLAQDSNAISVGTGIQINRLKSKSSSAYKNESWDLVDAYEADQKKIVEMPADQLPKELKGLDAEQRVEFIEAKKVERETVQKKIADLEQKRSAFLENKRKDAAKTKTLDSVMVDAVRKQAVENGFSY